MNQTVVTLRLGLVGVAALCCAVIARPGHAAIALTEHSAPAATPLAGWVTDAAHLLSAAEQATLTSKLKRLQSATGHQVVVVTVVSLGGRDIAAYARDLGNSWGVGRKRHNDGVVLLVAPNEHKVRIAVGYGLEKTLTDTECKRIIVEKMLPHFRAGEMARGIEAGTDAIISRLH